MQRTILLNSYFLGQPARELELPQFLESCEIGPGWHSLVSGLCLRLWSLGWDGRVAQCKEKFGGLRFYLDASSTISDQMWQLVRDAEQDSYNICEFCGASPASISKDRWWLKSLCTTCDSQSRVETPEQYQRDPQSVPDELVQH